MLLEYFRGLKISSKLAEEFVIKIKDKVFNVLYL